MYKLALAALTGAAFCIGAIPAAFAADLPLKARPPARAAAPTPVAGWSGCYVGGHVGYTWSNATDHSLPGAVALADIPGTGASAGDPIVYGYSGKYDSDGFAGGFQAGCDRQYGSVVVGLVGDFTWTDQKKDSSPFDIVPTPPLSFSNQESATINLKYFGTARGRVGYLFNPDTLVYATGGLAWARASMTVRGEAFFPGDGQVPYSVSNTTNFLGWTVGVGVDWRFAPNWTVGVEYLHLDFGDANFRFGTSFPNVTTTMALGAGTNVSLTSDVVRGTLNYRF